MKKSFVINLRIYKCVLCIAIIMVNLFFLSSEVQGNNSPSENRFRLDVNSLSASIDKVDLTCFEEANGSITFFNPTGGSGSFEYSIDGGSAWQPSPLFVNLFAGEYHAMMRDAANPSDVISVGNTLVLTQPAQLNATVTGSNVTGCYRNSNGSIKISSVAGGSGSYQYTIDGGQTWFQSPDFINRPAGVYNVIIRDEHKNTCTSILAPALIISQPIGLNGTLNFTQLSACESNDGSITISNPIGGSGIYLYTIDGGVYWKASGTFANLPTGNYNVQMKDAANINCTYRLTPPLALQPPPSITATISTINVTICSGYKNGAIQISSASGGSGNYEYSITGGSTWQTRSSIDSITVGIYDVRIRDSENPNCVVILDPKLPIYQPNQLFATATSLNSINCHGSSDGGILISKETGGSRSYQYSIDGGVTWNSSNALRSLQAGKYSVQMRDSNNVICTYTITHSLEIKQPDRMSAIVSSTNATCPGKNNGSITISNQTGGSGAYEFSKDNGVTWQTSAVFESLSVGSYNIMMRDNLNTDCSITLRTATIESGMALIIQSLYIYHTCPGESEGAAYVNLYNRNTATMIEWTGNQYNSKSFLADKLSVGNYSVTVYDQNGCSQTRAFFVPESMCRNVQMSPIRSEQCKENNVTISYTLDQPFNADNKVKIFISDSLANFANGKFIDSVETQQSGSINVSLQDIPEGKKYRFMVYTTSPLDISKPSSYDIQILSKPTLPAITGPLQSCIGSEVNFKAHGATNATTFRWYDSKGQLFPYDTLNTLTFTLSSEMESTVMAEAKNVCGTSEISAYTYDIAPLATWPLITASGITLSAPRALNYQWYMDGLPVPNGNTQSIIALKNGFYFVMINQDICTWADSLEFNGITFDEINHQLTVPEIEQATYEWYFNNQKISSAAANTLKPTQTGTYKAVVTFNQPTARTSAVTQAVYEFYYEGTVTGVSESILNHIVVRPNPGHGTFYLTSTTSLAGTTAALYNTAGFEIARQQLVHGTEAALDFSEVPAGMYYLKLTGIGGSGVKKLVVE